MSKGVVRHCTPTANMYKHVRRIMTVAVRAGRVVAVWIEVAGLACNSKQSKQPVLH
jgi:glutamine cyclotransferase